MEVQIHSSESTALSLMPERLVSRQRIGVGVGYSAPLDSAQSQALADATLRRNESGHVDHFASQFRSLLAFCFKLGPRCLFSLNQKSKMC